MAIYHFSGQVMSRVTKNGNIKSPLACAAYRSGDKLHDEKQNKTFYYKREVEPITYILTPEHAPSWTKDRERLWNEVNEIEKNYNAQFAREFNVALPIELSKEEQEKLTLEFCQEAFVDKGMVADIAIHRDDENNPHFHVMLTIRPFNEDGTWGIKAQREYIFDENGNHKLDKNGKKSFKKVNTTDWNDKSTLNSWRKLWADKTNVFLEKNGFSERITHLSNEARGLEVLPTIHEGYVARKMESKGETSDRVSVNREIKKYNNAIADLSEFKQQREQIRYENKFVRRFSPSEKETLGKIAKELKLFVNYSNLLQRKDQLQRWNKSLKFRPENELKFKQLERIENELSLIEDAENILEIESTRFIERYYPTWQISGLENYEKIAMVDETLKQNRLLHDDYIEEIHDEAYAQHLRNELDVVLHNRYAFLMAADKKVDILNHRKSQLKSIMGISPRDLEKVNLERTLRNATIQYPNELKEFKQVNHSIHELSKSRLMILDLYNLEIKKLYPNINFDKLKLEEKEMLLVGADYYQKPVTLDELNKRLLTRYSLDEQKELIHLLTGKDIPNKYQILKNKYPDFQIDNPRYVLLFKEECLSNSGRLDREFFANLNKIDPIRLAERELGKSDLLVAHNDILNAQYERVSNNIPVDPSYIAGGMFRELLQDRSYSSKKQFEEDMQTKKGKRKNINRGGMSL